MNNIGHLLGQFVVIGKFTVLGGTADETFDFTSTDTSIAGNVSLKTGQGFDSITFSATKKLQIIGKLDVAGAEMGTVHGALGGVASNLSVTEGDSFAVGGNVTFTAKNQSSGIELGGTNNTTISGNLTVTTGNTSTITVGGATGGLAAVLGSLTISSAEVIPPPSPIQAGTTSTTTLALLLVGGKFSLTTGASDDAVNMDDFTIRGASKIALGAGADHLNVETLGLPGISTFVGALKATLGAGNDNAVLGVSGERQRARFRGGQHPRRGRRHRQRAKDQRQAHGENAEAEWARRAAHALRPNFFSSSRYDIWIIVGRPCGQQ